MDRHRVVAGIADRIRLVVADHQVALGTQRIAQGMRQACIAVVEHAGVPGAGNAVHRRGEAVHGHQQRGFAAGQARVQFGDDPPVVGREDRLDALLPRRGIQLLVARYLGAVAAFGDQRRRGVWAVAVDHQARVRLGDRHRVQRRGQPGGDARDADVPADVPVQLRLRQPEVAQHARHPLAGVVGDQQPRRTAGCVVHAERRRFAGRQQRCGRSRGVSHGACRPGGVRSSTARPTAWHRARSPGPSSPPARRRRARAEPRAR